MIIFTSYFEANFSVLDDGEGRDFKGHHLGAGYQPRRFGVDPGARHPVGLPRGGTWWYENREAPRERVVDLVTMLLWQGFDGLLKQASR